MKLCTRQQGFKRMGFVKNLFVYKSLLNELTPSCVDIYELNDFIDNEIDNENIMYFNRSAIEVQTENEAIFKLVNTGYKDHKGYDIFGSFERISGFRWSGVYLGTKDFLKKKMLSKKDNYRMGLMLFDTKSEADIFIEDLHDNLLPGEKWSFGNNNGNSLYIKTDYPILESYIKNVFLKLIKDNLDEKNPNNINKGKIIISSDGKYLLFNSGLLNKYVQEIIIVGEIVKIENQQLWRCKNPTIVRGGQRDLINNYSFDKKAIEKMPEIVSFFENINQVIFDAKGKNIDINDISLEHCIEDRAARWPQKYQILFEKSELGTIAEALGNAIDKALIIAKRDYKYIVPQYRPETNEIQFLMPIYLENEYGNEPDFALVLAYDKKTELYYPETVLSLYAAYNNARLIAKPYDLWLNPNSINEKVVTAVNENEDAHFVDV